MGSVMVWLLALLGFLSSAQATAFPLPIPPVFCIFLLQGRMPFALTVGWAECAKPNGGVVACSVLLCFYLCGSLRFLCVTLRYFNCNNLLAIRFFWY